jgi:predicted transcriptional regulator
MGRRKSEGPTEGELEILAVLWKTGGATIRQITESVPRAPVSGIQSILKRVQLMEDKGLVSRDEGTRPAIYRAMGPEAKIKRGVLRHLMDLIFSGSMQNLVMHSLTTKKASREEIETIRRKLDQLEKGA